MNQRNDQHGSQYGAQHDGWALSAEGERIAYTLYRMPRRKHVHIVIGHDGQLQVRAPIRFTPAQAERIIHERSDWVMQTLGRMRAAWAGRPPLQSGTQLPFLDETLSLRIARDSTSSVARERDILHVRAITITEEAIRLSLERWYRHQAGEHLPGRVAVLVNRVGAHPSRVTIRGQRTRWGSCSARGHISLNWRLMLLPTELVDYVLVHELCHLHQLNHSPGFWALVGRLIPDWRERRKRLAEVRSGLAL